MRWIWTVMLVGCGGASPSGTPAAVASGEPTPEVICAHYSALRGEQCALLTESHLTQADCVPVFSNAQTGPDSSDRRTVRKLGRCLAASQHCADATACITAVDQQHPKTQAVSVSAICDRIEGPLAGCSFATGFGGDRDACIRRLGHLPAVVANSGACFVQHDDCDDVGECIYETGISKTDLRACAELDERAVGVPKPAWLRRKGAAVTRYGDADSSQEQPIETCGLPAESEWLFQATCNDGSHPIRTRNEAEDARTNVGLAGRCKSIVDRYNVKCPEETYEVFIDAYVCPLPD